jgi:hypothetical protein
MTWVLIIFTVIMFAWMIGGGIDAGNECNDVSGQYQDAKQAGCEAGTAIGIGALFGIWVFGFIILSLVWFMTRPRGRDCPVCGEKVKKGNTACQKCGHDFAAAAGGQPIYAGQGSVSRPPPSPQISAGWFPDPSGQAPERYWDGTQWTDQLRGQPAQQISAGWFPDPSGQAPERYWDGTQWTDQLRGQPAQQISAGWFPDPSGQAPERYWDGTQWTDQLRGEPA